MASGQGQDRASAHKEGIKTLGPAAGSPAGESGPPDLYRAGLAFAPLQAQQVRGHLRQVASDGQSSGVDRLDDHDGVSLVLEATNDRPDHSQVVDVIGDPGRARTFNPEIKSLFGGPDRLTR